uniref:Uncharacterized protein n=1 Tax=Pseudoderbesia arbuscula TaxID=2320809 RepID=A0A386AYR9_9CHLO|nr:hypothetical protein [Pseudoderbesia arbuscula]
MSTDFSLITCTQKPPKYLIQQIEQFLQNNQIHYTIERQESSWWFETNSQILDGGLLLQIEAYPEVIQNLKNFYDIQLVDYVYTIWKEQKSRRIDMEYIQCLFNLTWKIVQENTNDFALDMNNSVILRRHKNQLQVKPKFLKYLAGKIDLTYVRLECD